MSLRGGLVGRATKLDQRGTARRIAMVAFGALLVTAATALWIALGVAGPTAVRLVDDTVTAAAAALATAWCLMAARRDPTLRLFWSLMGGACLSWTLAETVWGVYDLVLREPVPVPSWADLGYLAAIPIAVTALLSHPTLRSLRRRTLRTLFDSLIIATALGFLSWLLVLGPLWKTTDLSTTGGLVAFAYPFGDVVMMFFVVAAARRMPRGERVALWCLLWGLLIMALSDSTYAYLTTANIYASGNLIDMGWVVAYLAVALSAFSATPSQRALSRAAPDANNVRTVLAPFILALIALVVAAVELRLGRALDGAATATALVLIALVLARQFLLMRELMAERPTAEARWVTGLIRVAVGRPVGASDERSTRAGACP